MAEGGRRSPPIGGGRPLDPGGMGAGSQSGPDRPHPLVGVILSRAWSSQPLSDPRKRHTKVLSELYQARRDG